MNDEELARKIATEICEENEFELMEVLGRGAFKWVFRIKTKAGESRALKIIIRAGANRRSQREAEALERCDHPNIATNFGIFDLTFANVKYQYSIEEFLAGGTLTSILRDLGTLSVSQTIELGQELIGALEHTAFLDLVHRDIKPDNIMFREKSDSPVLVDFGLVRDLSESSITETWAVQGPGTPYFASPEQLNNQKPLIDWRSDQFSLGVVLCLAHFNVHPFWHPGEDLFSPATVERVASRGERDSELLAKISESKLSCLIKMTEQWPVRRYRTPRELASSWNG